MQTPEEFLESNGLATATLDRAALIAAFQKEMEAGLAGEPSSLKMIPTYTSPYGEITKDVPVTVLDAGGTNFRGATVTIPSAARSGSNTSRRARCRARRATSRPTTSMRCLRAT